MVEEHHHFIPPQTEIGDYRVVNHFASGGMGDVYRVMNPLLREFFAMKVLRMKPGERLSDETIARFFKEARTTVRLRHSNIITLHTMGFEPIYGCPYFIMDYVGVSPLRRKEILSTQAWFSGRAMNEEETTIRQPLTLEQVLQVNGSIPENILRILALDIARALHTAHTFEDGVIHCDLKPSNILLRNDGHAVVTDFGIAQTQVVRGGATSSREILGTIDYMAPEQRKANAPLTPQTDIYAYGVMLYRLLTGTFPVGAWTAPSEYGYNPAWDVLLERCLEQIPEKRWASARDIYRFLHEMQKEGQKICRQRRMRRIFHLVLQCVVAFLMVLMGGVTAFIIQRLFL